MQASRSLFAASAAVLFASNLNCASRIGRTSLPDSLVDRRIEALAWLAGTWTRNEGDVFQEEAWSAPRGDAMFGIGRVVRGGRTVFFEYLRIESRTDGVFYVASPRGSGATDFRLVENTEARAVFENPRHDFPQRIIYWRDGDALRARTEGVRGGKQAKEDFFWERTDKTSDPR